MVDNNLSFRKSEIASDKPKSTCPRSHATSKALFISIPIAAKFIHKINENEYIFTFLLGVSDVFQRDNATKYNPTT